MLSIVMPTYNDEQDIQRAINAILNQSYKDFEFIIINDASLDNTDEIVKKYLEKDARIKYFVNSKNCGVAKSMNIGIQHAQGQYLFMASSDDWINKGFFEEGLKLLQDNPKIGLCFFDVTYVKEKKYFEYSAIPKTSLTTIFGPAEIKKIQKIYNFFIPSCATIVKKSELEKRGLFCETIGHFCDIIAFASIAFDTGCIYVPKVGSYFSLTSNKSNENKSRSVLMKEFSVLLDFLKTDRKLFQQLCYTTLLPKAFHYSLYTIFFNRKYWTLAFPMLIIKFLLIFSKKKRKKL